MHNTHWVYIIHKVNFTPKIILFPQIQIPSYKQLYCMCLARYSLQLGCLQCMCCDFINGLIIFRTACSAGDRSCQFE